MFSVTRCSIKVIELTSCHAMWIFPKAASIPGTTCLLYHRGDYWVGYISTAATMTILVPRGRDGNAHNAPERRTAFVWRLHCV